AAGCIDVAAARTANKRRNAGFNQQSLKRLNAQVRRCAEAYARPWIESNQIHFAPDSLQQIDYFAGILSRVIHIIEQHVLKSKALSISKREAPSGTNQRLEIPFPIDWHHSLAQLVIRSVQRDCKLRPD